MVCCQDWHLYLLRVIFLHPYLSRVVIASKTLGPDLVMSLDPSYSPDYVLFWFPRPSFRIDFQGPLLELLSRVATEDCFVQCLPPPRPFSGVEQSILKYRKHELEFVFEFLFDWFVSGEIRRLDTRCLPVAVTGLSIRDNIYRAVLSPTCP